MVPFSLLLQNPPWGKMGNFKVCFIALRSFSFSCASWMCLSVCIRQVPGKRNILVWGKSYKILEELKIQRGVVRQSRDLERLGNCYHLSSCKNMEEMVLPDLKSSSYAVETGPVWGAGYRRWVHRGGLFEGSWYHEGDSHFQRCSSKLRGWKRDIFWPLPFIYH